MPRKKTNNIAAKTKKIYTLLFSSYKSAFLSCSKTEKDEKGYWVYFDSYADFKKQQKKAKLWGLSSCLLVSACVITLFIVNIIFPVVFRSEASSLLSIKIDSAEKLKAGYYDNNIDVNEKNGVIRLKAQNIKLEKRTCEDFSGGYTPEESSLYPVNMVGVNDCEIAVNQGYAYSKRSNPALGDNHVTNVWLDEGTHLLYVSTWGGLSVIDTKNTPAPDDDELKINYSAASQPALPSNFVYHSWLDKENNYLYISNWGGLTVVNTKGTKDAKDDEPVFTYNTDSVPNLLYNKVRESLLDKDSGLLYVATDGGGLTIIDTKNTDKFSDDELLGNYGKTSQLAIPSDRIYHINKEKSGLLYLSTWGGGVVVVNTQNTPSLKDDAIYQIFNTLSPVKIASDRVYKTYWDEAAGLLYIATNLKGIQVIDTKKTFTAADDELDQALTDAINRSIHNLNVSDIYFDVKQELLYLSTNGGGLTVVDLAQDWADAPTLAVLSYDTDTRPSLSSNNITRSFISDSGLIYAATEGYGLSVVTSGEYSNKGVYVSEPLEASKLNSAAMAWEAKLSQGEKITVQTRNGKEDSAWLDDFDGQAKTEIKNIWGNGFGKINTNDSKLIFSGQDPKKGGASFALNVGSGSDFFPAGSIVRLRLKVNTADSDFSGILFTDDWEDSNLYFRQINQWTTLVLKINSPFSDIGLNLKWDENNWKNEDGLEIDWVSIEKPAEFWSEWSDESDTSDHSAIKNLDAGKKWLQYRVNIYNSEEKDSPSLRSFRFYGDYPEQGAYISKTYDAQEKSDWIKLEFQKGGSSSSNVRAFLQSGPCSSPDNTWSSWQEMNDAALSYKLLGRYFQYKFELETADKNQTPEVFGIEIKYIKNSEN